MPHRCCVPHCKGNYPNGPKVSVFGFPKNEEIKRKWLAAIKRKDFKPSPTSKVCELHFTTSDFETEASALDQKTGSIVTAPILVRRLKKNVIPSLFFGYPDSLQSTPTTSLRMSPDSKRKHRETLQREKEIKQALMQQQEFLNQKAITTVQDISRCVSEFGISSRWTFLSTDECVHFLGIDYEPIPCIAYSLKINQKLEASAFIKNCSLRKIGKAPSISFPFKVTTFSDIEFILSELCNLDSESHCDLKGIIVVVNDLLEQAQNEDNEKVISFIKEQLQLLTCSKNHLRYSPEMLVFCSLLRSISPHAYNFLRSDASILVPHPTTLKNICQSLPLSPEMEQRDEHFLGYIKCRFQYLNEKERIVVLQMDEIHIQAYFDYKGGTIVGMANDVNQPATSVFAFMISSVLSTFKEVVHVLPVHTINFTLLHDVIKKIIIGLEEIGFMVICLVSDNNAVNRKAMSLFANPPQVLFVYPHPVDKQRPLFFLFDSVHLFKNIRNNWLNQKNNGRCMFYPEFHDEQKENDDPNCIFKTASFNSLLKLHDIEQNSLVSYAHGLTLKSLSPNNMERQNVKLVLKIFNKCVIEGLRALGRDIPHSDETAEYISIVTNWWAIMNVKSPVKGFHETNAFTMPLVNMPDDVKVVFLSKFVDWLDRWKAMGCTTGSFSKETHDALHQTTCGMLELTKYCCEELNMSYILPGKFQTDNLEARFGKYRQLAGTQCSISLRQLLECEKKLRMQSLLSLELPIRNQKVSICNIKDIVHSVEERPLTDDTAYQNKFSMKIDDDDITKCEPYLPVLYYIAGYCCYSVLQKLNCTSCKEFLTTEKVNEFSTTDNFTFIKCLDRGGLLYPNAVAVNVVLYSYIVVEKLSRDFESNFFREPNQRRSTYETVFKILEDREMQFLDHQCTNAHTGSDLCKNIVWVATNVLLKNLCQKQNDKIVKQKYEKQKKRKLQTVKH